MAEVSFMDSSGLRVLIAGYKAAEQAGGALGVRNPSDVVTRLLEITGQLDRFVAN
jgi:anti-anti-sigma factor